MNSSEYFPFSLLTLVYLNDYNIKYSRKIHICIMSDCDCYPSERTDGRIRKSGVNPELYP